MRNAKMTIWVIVALIWGTPNIAKAEDTYWVGATGDWYSPANWQYKVPEFFDDAYIDNGGTAEIITGVAYAHGVLLGASSGASGNIHHTGGTNNAYYIHIADAGGSTGTYSLSGTGDISGLGVSLLMVGDRGTGFFHHTGGTNYVPQVRVGYYSDSVGTYNLSGTGYCSPSQEEYIGYYGTGTFDQTGGTNLVGENLVLGYEAGSNGRYTISGGTLSAEEIQVGYWGTGRFDFDHSSASITVFDQLFFGTDSTFTAVAGTEIHMAGASLDNWNTNETSMAGLNNLGLIFEGGISAGVGTFEVAGQDLGAVMAGLSENYALDELTLGGMDIGQVQLVDWRDNMTGAEALYVYDLTIGAGSYLDLNGYNLYYVDSMIDPSATVDYNGGELIQLLPGDVDLDGSVDGTDLSIITTYWGQSFILGREFGDLNGNGVVDGPDYAEVLSYWNPPPPSEPTPEPATLGLLLVGGLALLRRRH